MKMEGATMVSAQVSTCRLAASHRLGFIANIVLTSQPDDEKAQENLDIGHQLYRQLLNDALYLAAIGNEPRKVRSALYIKVWRSMCLTSNLIV
jgi:hypothetical protein